MRTSIKYSFYDLVGELLCLRKMERRLRKREFWAVEGLDIKLKRGQILALLGPNGAGKTTAVRLLSGILKPDGGELRISGKSVSLLRLRTAFNDALTGRENVPLLGVAMGYQRKFMQARMNLITQRSGLGDSMDSSVYAFSAGMRMRLAFAIIAQMKPDVLFLDAVFSVGDAGARAECLNIIREIAKTAGVIVSAHNMHMIRELCSSVIVMESGQKIYESEDVEKGIECYWRFFKEKS